MGVICAGAYMIIRKVIISMAAKKTGRRKSSGRRRKKKKDFEPFYKEIAVLIVFALFLFLFFSNFGWCGYLGDSISSFLFGVFGGTHYIIPLAGLLLSLLLISNDYSSLAVKKTFFSLLLLCMISAVQQMILNISAGDLNEAFYYSSNHHAGGGVVGTWICSLLYRESGIAGTIVVVFFISLISVILITERSFLAFLKKVTAPFMKKEKKRRKKKTQTGRSKTGESGSKKWIHKMPDLKIGRPKPKDASAEVPKASEEKPQQSFDFPLTEEQLQENTETAAAWDEPEPEPEVVQEPEIVPEEEPVKETRTRKKAKKEKEEEPAEVEILPAAREDGSYVFPPISLLNKGNSVRAVSKAEMQKTANKLEQTLENFGVHVKIGKYSCGPSVTRFELHPEQGVKVSKIVGLTDDIKLNLAAPDIRIEAPIPGKAAIGIEVPNKTNQTVMFRELTESRRFKEFDSRIAFAVGKDLSGDIVVSDIAKMPHLLIAGATGSGKSVCINTLIMSILYKARPDEVKLIMIDPKVVELSAYQGIPHLLIPVVTDPKQASSALNWAVMEMGERYKKFAEVNARNLKGYNDKVAKAEKDGTAGEDFQRLPQIVIIIDELADLMMVAPGEVEDAIVRLSQLARAAGIHLVIATQRPSTNVITGLIKANVPSRIAFSVSSSVDSRVIIDMNGAEKLLGKGDMLFYPSGYQKPIRVQGAFISDEEVAKVVEFLKSQNVEQEDSYGSQVQEKIQTASVKAASSEERDEYFEKAAMFLIDKDKASIGSLQRAFKIGFNRASRLMEQLCEAGIVSEGEGTKSRKVLMSAEEFEQYKEEYL